MKNSSVYCRNHRHLGTIIDYYGSYGGNGNHGCTNYEKSRENLFQCDQKTAQIEIQENRVHQNPLIPELTDFKDRNSNIQLKTRKENFFVRARV